MNKKRAKRGRPAQPDHLKHILERPAGRRAAKRSKPAMRRHHQGIKWYRKNRKKPAIAPESAKTLTPDQARREYFTFMGRTAFYAALKRKEIPSVKIGKRMFIPRAAIEHLLLFCDQPAGASFSLVKPPPLSQRRKGPIAPKGMRGHHRPKRRGAGK